MNSNRRTFLRGAGALIALPALESLGSAGLASQALGTGPAAFSNAPVKRLVTIGTYLGFHTPSWFPKETGAGYKMSKVLEPLEDMRSEFSLFSGLDHRAPNGHKNWSNFLTGKGTPGVSLDQIVAGKIEDQSRFASLQVTCGSAGEGRMSFHQGGHFPSVHRTPKRTFQKTLWFRIGQGPLGLCPREQPKRPRLGHRRSPFPQKTNQRARLGETRRILFLGPRR